jgi:DNA invertase Pin-like site-specific DNA recombinase
MQRAESCEDQEREVRKGFDLLGIDHSDAVVIKDEAQPGTKSDRDGFVRLLEMTKRGEISVLGVDDQSRLSRSSNAFSFIKNLVFSGGRFVSTGEGIDTSKENWELSVQVMELHHGLANGERGRQVRRGQLGRVLEDQSAGDFPYGYGSYYLDPASVETYTRGPRPKKGLRVKEEEAQWVRQIFIWFVVHCTSIAAIARELTRLGVPKGRKASSAGWHHQQIRRMLSNPKYIGVWPWGATKIVRDADGKVKQQLSPERKVVRNRTDLRIIDDVTWEKAQRRLADLHKLYGPRPGQKRRGAKPHATGVSSQSLLRRPIDCHRCDARLWMKTQRGYMTCPNHRKGICSMGAWVPLPRAEQALIDFVGQLLNTWPEWFELVVSEMREALAEAAERIPAALKADEARLRQLEARIENLVDQLADGSLESPAIRRRLIEHEREAEELRARIKDVSAQKEGALSLPDDEWIKAQMANLASLLREEPAQAALLFRRLLGKVTADVVVAPGKVRGFVRLYVRVDAVQLLVAALGDRVPEWVFSSCTPAKQSPEFQLDLGAPTRPDKWAPEIAEMRDKGMKWAEIAAITGIAIGNASNVLKRWRSAKPPDRSESA